jgi:isoprenylcysteine carboxyl methyltransferase (ICMT) family protein YpbQ
VRLDFSLIFYSTMVLLLFCRAQEMWLSRKNEKLLLNSKLTGLVDPREHYLIYIFHGCWFAALIAEALFRSSIISWMWIIVCVGLWGASQAMRYKSMKDLGDLWTAKIFFIPPGKRVST